MNESTLLSLLTFGLGVAGAIWGGGIVVGRWRTSLDAVTTQIVDSGRSAARAHEAVLEQIERAEERCAKRDEMLQHEIGRVAASVSRAHERIDTHVGDLAAHGARRANGAG